MQLIMYSIAQNDESRAIEMLRKLALFSKILIQPP